MGIEMNYVSPSAAVFVCYLFAAILPDAVSGRFVAVSTSMSWADGNAYCAANYGTTLATVTSDDEAEELNCPILPHP